MIKKSNDYKMPFDSTVETSLFSLMGSHLDYMVISNDCRTFSEEKNLRPFAKKHFKKV